MHNVMHIEGSAMSRLSSAARDALADAVLGELCERGLDHVAAAAVTRELLPFWAAWDALGGFAPEADHAALFAAWERQQA